MTRIILIIAACISIILLADPRESLSNLSLYWGVACFLYWSFALITFIKDRKRDSLKASQYFRSFVYGPAVVIAEATKRRWAVRLSALASIFFILFLPFVSYFSNTEIGSFLEKEEYTSQYYVMASRLDDKYYRRPAQIERNTEYSDTGYDIQKLFWGNGGYLVFSDGEYDDYPNSESILKDQDGNEWSVYLTTEKVSGYASPVVKQNQLENFIFFLEILVVTMTVFSSVYVFFHINDVVSKANERSASV